MPLYPSEKDLHIKRAFDGAKQVRTGTQAALSSSSVWSYVDTIVFFQNKFAEEAEKNQQMQINKPGAALLLSRIMLVHSCVCLRCRG